MVSSPMPQVTNDMQPEVLRIFALPQFDLEAFATLEKILHLDHNKRRRWLKFRRGKMVLQGGKRTVTREYDLDEICLLAGKIGRGDIANILKDRSGSRTGINPKTHRRAGRSRLNA